MCVDLLPASDGVRHFTRLGATALREREQVTALCLEGPVPRAPTAAVVSARQGVRRTDCSRGRVPVRARPRGKRVTARAGREAWRDRATTANAEKLAAGRPGRW